MSSIPSSAMPHAGPAAEPDQSDEGETMTLARRVRNQADRVADLVRDNPKTAIAAGAALAAGVAAAAVPLVRAKRRGAKTTAAPKAPAAKAPARKRTPARTKAKKS